MDIVRRLTLLISKKLILLTAFITCSLFAYHAITPPAVSAQQSQNNTAVFSGQVIPAFVGTAYDPSYAYQRLAGLPVYVYAYDSWNPGGQFIINNYAVRTQLRLDGSFQAQGLPNAANYAVYFPFVLDGDKIKRIDCGPDAPSGTLLVSPECNTSIGLGANISGDDVPFRMPQLENRDEIQSVFSYNIADPGPVTINTQVAGEQVGLGPSFLTQERRVDISNNINTFPLIPTTTLSIKTKIQCFYRDDCLVRADDAYEIIAQRVVVPSATASNQAINTPIIGGRTSFPLSSTVATVADPDLTVANRNFQVYAPEGLYAITVWRAEGGTTYQNYSPGNAVDSSLVGFGFQYVNPRNGIEADWSRMLDINHNHIPLFQDAFYVWGRVLEATGGVSKDATTIGLVDTQNDLIDAIERMQCSSGPAITFSFFPHPDFDCATETTVLDAYGNPTDNTINSFGVYAFMNRSGAGLSATDSRTRFRQFETYIDDVTVPTLDGATESTTEQLSNFGPQQLDLIRRNKPSTGLLFKITPPPNISLIDNGINYDVSYNRNGATLTIRPEEGEDSQEIFTGDADGKGYVYVPDLPTGNYTAVITFPGANPYILSGADIPQLNPYEKGAGLSEIPITLDPITIVQWPKPYKVLGLVPVPYLIPKPKDVFADNTSVSMTISMDGANQYQALSVENYEGKQVFAFPEDAFADKSGKWTVNIPLTYQEPETACDTLPRPSNYWCQEVVKQNNTYVIKAVADGQVKSQQVLVAEDISTGLAAPIPARWDAEFVNECDLVEERAEAAHTAAKNAELDPNPGTSLTSHFKNFGVHLQYAFKGFFNVNMLNVGCRSATTFADYAATGLESIRRLLIIEPLTISRSVVATWDAMRSIGNILAVFIVLIMGLLYTIGYDTKNWNISILLPELIKGILLGNLSLLIVQALLDVNNVLTSWIFSILFNILKTNGLSANAIGDTAGVAGMAAVMAFLGTIIAGGFASAISAIFVSGGALAIPVMGMILSFAMTLIAMVIGLLAVLFGRYLVIWIIVIVAPVAFMLSVLPWFKSLKDLWWKTLLPFTFMQTIMAFLLAIGILLMSQGGELDGFMSRAGTILIGIGSIFMAMKSPQIATSFFGGGLAGAAMGAIGGVTATGSQFLSSKAASIQKATSASQLDANRSIAVGQGMYSGKRGAALKIANVATLGTAGAIAGKRAQAKQAKALQLQKQQKQERTAINKASDITQKDAALQGSLKQGSKLAKIPGLTKVPGVASALIKQQEVAKGSERAGFMQESGMTSAQFDSHITSAKNHLKTGQPVGFLSKTVRGADGTEQKVDQTMAQVVGASLKQYDDEQSERNKAYKRQFDSVDPKTVKVESLPQGAQNKIVGNISAYKKQNVRAAIDEQREQLQERALEEQARKAESATPPASAAGGAGGGGS